MYRLRSILVLPLCFAVLGLSAIGVAMLMIFSLGKLHAFTTRHVGRITGITILKLVGVDLKVRWEIPENHPPAVFILNHASTLDIFIIIALGLRKVRFVAKKELQYNPLFFIMGRLTGQIFINRADGRSAVESIRKASDSLKKTGYSIMLAPEGSRHHPGRIGPFKKGAFRLAADLQYPVIPIFIEGAYELSHGKTLFIKPGTVTAYIKPPVDTSGWDSHGLDQKVAEVRALYLRWVGLNEEPVR